MADVTNWKNLFEQKILDRGYRYFHDGNVEDFNVSDGIILATVNGTEMYDIVINVENDEIKDMQCSCPYAEEGRNCKHMAAVLYKWDFIRANSKEDIAAVIGQLDYYSKFYPHKIIAIKELRLDTGMGLAEAQNAIDELFSKIDAKNEKQAGYTYAANNEYNAKRYSKPKKNRGFGASFRLFNLKFWIFITGLMVFESAVGIFHPGIDMGEAIALLLLSAPIFVLLMKRHKYLKQYFDSAEYDCKKEEKRRINTAKQQQRNAKTYKESSQNKPISKQKDSGGSGCCLAAFFLLIFYAPIKLIAGLTKKYY